MAANEVEGGKAAHPSGDGLRCGIRSGNGMRARAPVVLLNGAEWTPFRNLVFYRTSKIS